MMITQNNRTPKPWEGGTCWVICATSDKIVRSPNNKAEPDPQRCDAMPQHEDQPRLWFSRCFRCLADDLSRSASLAEMNS
jgi:hypothetical protein